MPQPLAVDVGPAAVRIDQASGRVACHTFKFAQAAADALGSGAALQVRDADEALVAMAALTQDRERLEAMRAAARAFAAAHRGATARIAAIARELLMPG